METYNKFDELVCEAIKANKEVRIPEVVFLENIYSAYFDNQTYPALLDLLKQQKLDEMPKDLMVNKDSFREYLEIYKFSDPNGKVYAVTIYDNDELNQDPQIIDLISL